MNRREKRARTIREEVLQLWKYMILVKATIA